MASEVVLGEDFLHEKGVGVEYYVGIYLLQIYLISVFSVIFYARKFQVFLVESERNTGCLVDPVGLVFRRDLIFTVVDF